MREVSQVHFGAQAGDCLRAAIASLLDKDREDVPHFGLFADWPTAVRLWADGIGLSVVQGPFDPDLTWVRRDGTRFGMGDLPPLLVLWGNTARHAVVTHAVVGTPEGVLRWDPHPSRQGLTRVRGWLAFVPATVARETGDADGG